MQYGLELGSRCRVVKDQLAQSGAIKATVWGQYPGSEGFANALKDLAPLGSYLM
jgi:hypothetical protein